MARIILIRHGESEGNVHKDVKVKTGDMPDPLTAKGWAQAQYMGRASRQTLEEIGLKKWPKIYLSTYERSKQTFRGWWSQIQGLFPGTPDLFPNIFITEQSFGGLSHLTSAELDGAKARDFAQQFINVSNQVYKNDPVTAKAPFGESYKETMDQVQGFINTNIREDIKHGEKDIIIFCHGRIITAFLALAFNVPIEQIKSIKTPGHCDMYEIIGKPGNWKSARKIYDGLARQRVDNDPLAHIQPVTVENLGPVPERYRID